MNCVSLMNFAMERKASNVYPKKIVALKERKNLKKRSQLTSKSAINEDPHDVQQIKKKLTTDRFFKTKMSLKL